MRKITYPEFKLLCTRLLAQLQKAKIKPKGIYGIPRGGVPVAVQLAALMKLPLVTKPGPGILIVDDICDSGRTLEQINLQIPVGASAGWAATLFVKPHAKLKPNFSVEMTDEWIQFPWEGHETPAEDAVVRMLEVIGEDPNREGLLDTPKRVIKSYGTLFGGYKADPKELLKTTFHGEGYDQIVLLDNIEFFSTCEHHLLPFFGKAHVAYIPRKRVVGLSKLARIVECFSRRLQIQERLTDQIAGALDEALDPEGVAVVLQAKHFCMVARGVQKQNSVMTTSSLKGLFKTDTKARTEFMTLIGRSQ